MVIVLLAQTPSPASFMECWLGVVFRLKAIVLSILFFGMPVLGAEMSPRFGFERWNEILREFVSDGKVEYKNLKSSAKSGRSRYFLKGRCVLHLLVLNIHGIDFSMYNPQLFKSADIDEAFELMDRNPFATVITVSDGKPLASHLSLTPKKVGNQIELIGHLARANPHWKTFEDSRATVIFHGPHTYITPTWYAENDVPTWNYSIVHIAGKIELVESHQGIVDCQRTFFSC